VAVTLRRPGIAGVGELLALGLTAVGLLLLLPSLGGIGAALVSVVAYAVNFAWLLAIARRKIGGSLRDYLVPTRGDVAVLWSGLQRLLRRRQPNP
jgi:O-antigen/teichoic acid export membrane protein